MVLASVSNDLKIYNCNNWNLQYTVEQNKETLKDIKWSDDAKYIALVGNESEVEILLVTDEQARSVQRVTIEEPTAASFLRSGARSLAVGCRSGKTYIWDTKFKNVVKTFYSTTSPSSPVKFIDFNTKNTFLAAALESGDTIIFGTTTNNQLGTIKVPHSKIVTSLAFHKELRSVLGIATEEGSILLKDIGVSKDKMFLNNAHAAPITGISFSPINKDVMVSCSYDKKMHVHDVRLQTIVSTINSDKFLTCVDMNSESHVALGSKNGDILIYDLRNFKKPLYTLTDHKSRVNCVAFRPVLPRIKKNSTYSMSCEEISNIKPTTPQKSTSKNSSDYVDGIDMMISPAAKDIPAKMKTKENNISNDSFLVNLIDQDDVSHSSANLNDSKAFNLNNNALKTNAFGTKSKLNLPLNETDNKREMTSVTTSTPVLARVQANDSATPSPILKNSYDANGNTDSQKHQTDTLKKSMESIDGASVKLNPNFISDLGNELKNYIRFSMCDVLEECRNNYIKMTMEQTKNRLFLEDQIAILNQKMQSLQQSQHILLEENKKLLIEIEMLRMTK